MIKGYFRKKYSICMAIFLIAGSLSGCGEQKQSYETFKRMEKVESTLAPVDSYNHTDEVLTYTEKGVKEDLLKTYTSEDGLCEIRVFDSYYDVTLNYENGNDKQVGEAYANTILTAFPEYETLLEPYLYENIRHAFRGDNYSSEAIACRIDALFENLPKEYQEEIEGFASAISKGERGFLEDHKISYEEAVLAQMIPDTLRPTACSALSLWGEKTKTGDPITLRCLEWTLGSENHLGLVNTVLHIKKQEHSLTSIGMLGILDVFSAINDDGVFVGILDVGSTKHEAFEYEGKMSYTFAVRYALEHFDNATDVGNYMIENSPKFTWCHNLIITDKDNSYCAEDCVSAVSDKNDGFSILRDAHTPLLDGLCWDSKDSLCVVNSFATKGNQDRFTESENNRVRFYKYNKWVKETDKFSVLDVKNMITAEKVNQFDVQTVHQRDVAHMVIVDYHTGNIQVAFTGVDGVKDKPIFLDIGNY